MKDGPPLDTKESTHDERYVSLQKVLDRAYNIAATGKGVRHANSRRFEEQPMFKIADMFSCEGNSGAFSFQIVKKLEKLQRLTSEQAVDELLSVIVYAAAFVIYKEKQSRK